MGKRIEYIDAMRGFTMILVVYSHICNYCLGDKWMAFNDVFFLFRMPCFFFISGWLFEKLGRTWNRETMKDVIRKKFMVQIIPTFIFLLLLAPPPLFFTRLGGLKGGYWFTFALFEYFVLYILSARYCRRWGLMFAVVISVSSFYYDVYYNRLFSGSGWLTDILGVLSFMTWRYYLFFYLGTLVKRHFATFLQLTSNWLLMLLGFLGFIGMVLMSHSEIAWQEYFRFAVGGILGVILVFTFFRIFALAFAKEKILGRGLQFIGTRTLDIYLLHYFFLPRFLLPYSGIIRQGNIVLDMAVVLVLAMSVIAVCLVVSYLIRLSPFLGRYLFGVQGKSN